MAEDTTPLPPPDAGPERGRTTIAPKVLEQLGCRAALEVAGVERYSPGPDALAAFTTDLPSCSVETAGQRVSVRLKLAVDWTMPAVEVGHLVRDHVRARLQQLSGWTVDRVDVTVATLLMPSQTSTPRRRVQ